MRCLLHCSQACTNLLRAYTTNIFAVTSELDTQVARAVRASLNTSGDSGLSSIDLACQQVFTTFVGFRSAEPCTISVAATHHLLTQLLIFIMGYLHRFDGEALMHATPYRSEEVHYCVGPLHACPFPTCAHCAHPMLAGARARDHQSSAARCPVRAGWTPHTWRHRDLQSAAQARACVGTACARVPHLMDSIHALHSGDCAVWIHASHCHCNGLPR